MEMKKNNLFCTKKQWIKQNLITNLQNDGNKQETFDLKDLFYSMLSWDLEPHLEFSVFFWTMSINKLLELIGQIFCFCAWLFLGLVQLFLACDFGILWKTITKNIL